MWRALELGINYFDTAQMYGNGESERNLGRVLKALKPDVYVGTKVRLPPTERGQIGAAIAASLERACSGCSASRSICSSSTTPIVGTHQAAPISRPIRCSTRWCPLSSGCAHQGKIRFFGITANGETAALHRVIDARAFDTGQASYNLLNPSPAAPVPEVTRRRTTEFARPRQAADMGIIKSGCWPAARSAAARSAHALGSPPPAPIGSGATYQTRCRPRPPLRAAGRGGPRRQPDRGVLRYVIADPAVSTVLIGIDDGASRNTPRVRSKRAAVAGRPRPRRRNSSAALPASRDNAPLHCGERRNRAIPWNSTHGRRLLRFARNDRFVCRGNAMLKIIPTGETLGATVEGLDLAQPLVPREFAEILQGARRIQRSALPGAATRRGADEGVRRRASARSRSTSPAPTRSRAIPKIMILSNIVENGRPIGARDAGQDWHTDMSYSETIALANMLYAHQGAAARRQAARRHRIRQHACRLRRPARGDEDAARRHDRAARLQQVLGE